MGWVGVGEDTSSGRPFSAGRTHFCLVDRQIFRIFCCSGAESVPDVMVCLFMFFLCHKLWCHARNQVVNHGGWGSFGRSLAYPDTLNEKRISCSQPGSAPDVIHSGIRVSAGEVSGISVPPFQIVRSSNMKKVLYCNAMCSSIRISRPTSYDS